VPAPRKFGFDLVGIGSALADRRLGVPIYQRSYAWGDEDAPGGRDQVGEFWSDLRTTFGNGDTEYFLGTVVLSREGLLNRTTIIDGQQRLATTALLMAAIRDEFIERGDANRGGILHNRFLATPDLATGGQVPQLILNADDNSYFQRRVIEANTGVAPRRRSHRLIDRAYAQLRAEIHRTSDDAGAGWSERLLEWVTYLAERVRIIVVEVPNEADAFLIFETLNDRGADLTIADLLKNYLFGRSGEQLDPVRNDWVSSLSNLDIAVAGNQLFTDFLRHYWSSKYGATRERELYAAIKQRVASATNAVDFAAELQVASRLYAAILHGDHEFWTTLGTVTQDNVDVLAILNLEQNRPLILAVMQHFPPTEIKKAMKALVSWGVRGLIVGGIGGGTAERIYCEAAIKVRNGTIQDTNALRTGLSTLAHSDAEFEKAFATARIARGTLARYVLVALERTQAGTPEPELVPNDDENEVNLEHILPKNPVAADWSQFTSDERHQYLHRIGNLALLSKGPNGKIGNRPFSDKKPILAQSALVLTKLAGAPADWTPEEVDNRQKALAALASKTWPR
jgi:hypothetical protein